MVVVADSHNKPHPKAYQWIEREEPTAILHAGDIGRLAVLDELEAIAPTVSVRGNIDGHDTRTPDHVVLDITRGEQGLRVLLTHIAVQGPRLRKDAAELAHRHDAQLVVCGHSHIPLIAHDRGCSVFNPGSLGPRRFHLPITFGVLDFHPDRLELRHVDCETGAAWMPPGVP